MMIFPRWFSKSAQMLPYGAAFSCLVTGAVFAADLQAPEGLENIPHVPVIFSTPPSSSVVGYPSNLTVGSGNPYITLFGTCGIGACRSVPIDFDNQKELEQFESDLKVMRQRDRTTNEKLRSQRGLLN